MILIHCCRMRIIQFLNMAVRIWGEPVCLLMERHINLKLIICAGGLMFNVQVNYPDDMTEIIRRIVDFQTDKLINEYTPKEVEAVIKYLEETEMKNNKKHKKY